MRFYADLQEKCGTEGRFLCKLRCEMLEEGRDREARATCRHLLTTLVRQCDDISKRWAGVPLAALRL